MWKQQHGGSHLLPRGYKVGPGIRGCGDSPQARGPLWDSVISLSVFPTSLILSISLNSLSSAHLSSRTFHSVPGLPSEAKSPVWVMLKNPSGSIICRKSDSSNPFVMQCTGVFVIVLNSAASGLVTVTMADAEVKHLFLEAQMSVPCPGCERQMLEVENTRPRIAEIRNPRDSCLLCHFHRYDMHGVWRSRAHDDIHRMFLQIFFEEPHGRSYPQASRVGDEQVSSYCQGDFPGKGFPASVYRIHFAHVP